MKASAGGPELQRIYSGRFSGRTEYRDRVWKALAAHLARWLEPNGAVLDLGAGYCEFINNVPSRARYAMDLNPDTRQRANPGVEVLQQDCAGRWPFADEALDTVFTSNFLEHLPDKATLSAVLGNAYRCLRPGGRFVAMGPNIRYVPGAYWDFFDHYIPLTELSMAEALAAAGFEVEQRIGRFLPYTMSRGRQFPIWMVRLYLAVPLAWKLLGKQFLVVGRKPAHSPAACTT